MSTHPDIHDVDFGALAPVHVVGIGGAGMSAIARILLARGIAVSGSDAKDSRRISGLRALGARVEIGHDPAHLVAGDGSMPGALVVSTAIRPDNPELVRAHELDIPVLSRATALAAVMRGHKGIAVSGTHGKTTTTSMLTVALQHAGADPSFVIGSELHESGANAHQGTGDLFVVEADESDGTTLALEPIAAIVTNVEADHLDHWGTVEAVEQGFLDFALLLPERSGFLVVCIDDAGGRRLAVAAGQAGVDVRTYGVADDADYRMELLGSGQKGPRLDVIEGGVRLGAFELAVPGAHNALNAVAALVTGIGLGYPAATLRDGLASFSGTRRRFDFRGEVDGVRVYDDYAHHPTEITATLTAARDVVGEGRLVVAFQAHHYYRTALFSREFGQALGLADEVVVLEVFAPGEEPLPGASGQSLAANVPLPAEQVVFEPSWSKVAGHLAQRARSGDIVMTLGAGDISMIGPEVLDLLREKGSQG